MNERPVKTRIYSDSKFLSLTADAKWLFVYSFTNKHIGMSGYYELADQLLQIETGLSGKKLEAAKASLEENKMVFFKDGWIFVKNAQRNLSYSKTEHNLKIAKSEENSIPIWFKKYTYTGRRGGSTPPSLKTIDYRPKTKDKRPTVLSKLISTKLEDFNQFWLAYPRKVNKKSALRVWRVADLPLLEELLAILEKHKASAQWLRGFIPHPTTWLNQERWKDELEEEEFTLESIPKVGKG